MHLTNYSGRKYLVEVVGDRVLLDGFLVATLTKTYEGEELASATLVIDRHSLKTIARWVYLQEQTNEIESTYRHPVSYRGDGSLEAK